MRKLFWAILVILAVSPSGCSRTRYRLLADRDAHALLHQKAGHAPWSPPSDFGLHPQPTSRLHDPTPLDDPWLPLPAPQLYSYRIPELPERMYGQSQPHGAGAVQMLPSEIPNGPPAVQMELQSRVWRLPPIRVAPESPVQWAGHQQNTLGRVDQAAFQEPAGPLPAAPQPPPLPQPVSPATPAGEHPSPSAEEGTGEVALDVPSKIPRSAWESVPKECRARMFEFERLRSEYHRSWDQDPTPEMVSAGQRLSLEEIVHLTLLNSREYQTQKEVLYRSALRLSLERFAYQLKFSPLGNGTDVNYNHTRTGGTTVNGLGVPTNFQVDKMLASGGDLLARFANQVVLTFNGPAGFAADVGSDLFLEFDQAIFQRDVRYESLTQAERNVIYAAREFTRFRKTLFTQLAAQYYSLIRTYRQVEIDSQNYFTLVRAFDQSQAEFRTYFLPRFQLDQVEQNVLSGRSRLIATCNSLEQALDNLKIRMGLPTETPINIDLGELDQLTARDELAVAGELVRRVRQRLLEERQAEQRTRVGLLSETLLLSERMLEAQTVRSRVEPDSREPGELSLRWRRLRVEAARENAKDLQRELDQELQKQPPDPSKVFLRTLDLVDAFLQLLERQLELANLTHPSHPELAEFRNRHALVAKGVEEFRRRSEKLSDSRAFEQLPQLVEQTGQLRGDAEMAVTRLDALLGLTAQPVPGADPVAPLLGEADELLRLSEQLLNELGGGLTPIEIDVDDAMLTALNMRFDLMNQRGLVADNWRQIKYAGDDLRSVLNINASHTLSTRTDVNRVFDFTFDESDTRVRASFDAPFNRRSQRNSYRQSLINYQASLRQLMALEDNIKLAVRNDLRSLSLDKEQYAIEVASAALAYERVGSVRLELRLGVGRVAARDFLEAQNAYASSLSNVASRHIGYITDRMQLFVDLELLNVEEDGFWPELYDEKVQPEPYYQLPPYALPVYGELVPGLWYSKYLRRMERIPPGDSAVHELPPAEPALEEVPTPPASP